jgi:MFS family permease
VIVSFYGAGQVAASIIGGQLTDRIGRRATMAMSLFSGAIAMAALGQARDLDAITALVGAVGFVGEMYRPAVSAYVADVVPPAKRLYAFGLLYWAVNLGFAFAGIVGGLIADYDFSILFWGDAITSAVYGAIVLVTMPETRPPTEERAGRSASRSPLGDGPFMVFVALNFLTVSVLMQVNAPLAAHMTWQGFSPATYGMVIAVNGILIIALQPLVAGWIARFDPSRILAAAALLYGAALGLHGMATVALAHAGAVAIWTLGEIIEAPTKSAIVAAMAPVDARGRYTGMLVMSWGLGLFVGPRLGTWIWQERGPEVLWSGCVVACAVIAVLLVATAPARRRRLARVPDR